MKSASTEQLRMQYYLSNLQGQHDLKVRELEKSQAEEVQRKMDGHQKKMADLQEAYDLQLSEEAQRLEAGYSKRQHENQMVLETLTKDHEAQMEKLRSEHQKVRADFQIQSEQEIMRLRDQYQKVTKDLHQKVLSAERSAQIKLEKAGNS